MRPAITRTLTTAAAPQAVFDYLADFTTTVEWDPGTRSCERISGDGGEGSVYRNVSTFLGRTVEVAYVATVLEPPSRIHFSGSNAGFTGHDVFGIGATDGGGSTVRYQAQFSFRAGWIAPLVALYLPLLARRTVRHLQRCLDRLGAGGDA